MSINHPNTCESNKNGAVEPDLISFRIPVDYVFNAIKDQSWVRRPTRPLSQNPKGPGFRDYCAFHDKMDHPIIECRILRRHLHDLVNQGYLREFTFSQGQPSETKVQKEHPPQDSQASSALIQYREVNVIFGSTLIDYVNKARRGGYLAILTSPSLSLGRPIYFSETDAYVCASHTTMLWS